MIKSRTTSYRESLLKSLKDPEEAVEYGLVDAVMQPRAVQANAA